VMAQTAQALVQDKQANKRYYMHQSCID